MRTLGHYSDRNSLSQLINSSTRSTKKSATLIDHIYINNISDVSKSGVIPYGISDHDIVYVLIKREYKKKSIESFWCRSMANFSLTDLKDELSTLNWNDFYSCRNPTRAWELMYHNYVYTLNKIAPFVEMKVRSRGDWTNASLLNLIRDRDRAKEQCINLVDEDLKEQKFKEFKEFRGKVKESVISEKRGYIQSKLDVARKDGKLYWTELNQLYPGKKQKGFAKLTLKLIDSNNVEIPPDQLHDYVNEYFTTVGQKLAEVITLDNAEYIHSFDNAHDAPVTVNNFDPINRIELHDVIKNIDITKGSNVDNISSKLLKCCLLATQSQVLYLFN